MTREKRIIGVLAVEVEYKTANTMGKYDCEGSVQWG